MKFSTKFLLALALFGSQNHVLLTSERSIPVNSAELKSEVDQALFSWLQALDPQSNDLISLIKTHFKTDNPAVIDFIVDQVDHVNLAVSIFKTHFAEDEIKQILAFHTSNVGQKFGVLFPVVMQDYQQALDGKIETVKRAIIAYAKQQEEQK